MHHALKYPSRLCFLQCNWQREIFLQKVINVKEAQAIAHTSPDPLLVGGAWAQNYLPKPQALFTAITAA